MNYSSKKFIEKELCSLKRNKATGLDELLYGLLKDCTKNISEPLYYIMNLSIKTSIVPNIWKAAKVVPIFKSGNHDLPENHRPISLLPVLSKVFEKAVHSLLQNKLNTYGVSGKKLNWFTDYLFNRTQIVEIENVRPGTEPVYCGVPQGSILGPL